MPSGRDILPGGNSSSLNQFHPVSLRKSKGFSPPACGSRSAVQGDMGTIRPDRRGHHVQVPAELHRTSTHRMAFKFDRLDQMDGKTLVTEPINVFALSLGLPMGFIGALNPGRDRVQGLDQVSRKDRAAEGGANDAGTNGGTLGVRPSSNLNWNSV